MMKAGKAPMPPEVKAKIQSDFEKQEEARLREIALHAANHSLGHVADDRMVIARAEAFYAFLSSDR